VNIKPVHQYFYLSKLKQTDEIGKHAKMSNLNINSDYKYTYFKNESNYQIQGIKRYLTAFL